MKNNAIFLTEQPCHISGVYGEELIKKISEEGRVLNKAYIIGGEDFSETEYIFSTWGMPAFTEDEIKKFFPNLKAVFYAAGSVQTFAKEFLNCGVRVFSAWRANAVPVAEFTVSQILLSTKGYFKVSAEQSIGNLEKAHEFIVNYPGNYKTPVGIIGVGMIGRKVIELLKPFSLEIYAYDAFMSEEELSALGAKKVTLEELFESSLAVSNHLANNAATIGMLNYNLFKRFMPYATFINTGRGAQVVEDDLVKILTERDDVTALLDVTYPEPPRIGHDFYKLKNCFLTPHIAGSMGREVKRMGEYIFDAYTRTLAGETSDCEVTPQMLKTMA